MANPQKSVRRARSIAALVSGMWLPDNNAERRTCGDDLLQLKARLRH